MRIVLFAQDFSRLWTSSPPPTIHNDGSTSGLVGNIQIVPEWRLQAKNFGPIAVKGVVIMFQPALPKDATVEIRPPLEFRRGDKEGVTRLYLVPPLGAGQLLEARIVAPTPRGFRPFSTDETNSYNALNCNGFGSDTCPESRFQLILLISDVGKVIQATIESSPKASRF